MPHQIIIDGRLLDPKEAARRRLPFDTNLICPHCEGDQVVASVTRTGQEVIRNERKLFIPRQQDRRCLDCDYRWMVTLPPEFNSTFF